MSKTILVSGGAGYIGSHCCVELLNSNYDVVVVDDLINSKAESLRRVERITGRKLRFYRLDVCNETQLDKVFTRESIDGVIHFAGLKAVGESVAMPLRYYRNNLNSTMALLSCMERHGVNSFVFSSSATVYGDALSPLSEETTLGCTNPYGWTKFMSERIIADWSNANRNVCCLLLRYFNPIGAHESGLIGEDPNGIPNNLLPYISQTAVGKRDFLNVYGNDYPTPDGTGVRDYIHVVDLAKGHLDAIEYCFANSGTVAINLGTGRGYSVLEVVKAFEKASGVKIPYKFAARRPGDIAVSFADASKAFELLGWKATRDIECMCTDSYRFATMNPNGYEE